MNIISLLKALWVFAAVLLMSFIGSLILPESGLSVVFAVATVGAILTFLFDRNKTGNNHEEKKD